MSKRYAVFIDSFSSADDKGARGRYVFKTYADVKRKVLEAGKFSSFEASERPGIYDQFSTDPEIVLTNLGYPWIGVRKRELL